VKARPALYAFAMLALALVPAGCAEDRAGSSANTTTTTAGPPVTPPRPARLDVVATEYEWSGLPEALPAGSYPLSFSNVGAEAHEISIFRNREDRPLEELFELGPEGIKGAVDMVGTLIAGPDAAAGQELTIALTPGEYDVVCFLPATSDRRPHFTHGMHRTLVVTP
jgi:hypothetical protein